MRGNRGPESSVGFQKIQECQVHGAGLSIAQFERTLRFRVSRTTCYLTEGRGEGRQLPCIQEPCESPRREATGVAGLWRRWVCTGKIHCDVNRLVCLSMN